MKCISARSARCVTVRQVGSSSIKWTVGDVAAVTTGTRSCAAVAARLQREIRIDYQHPLDLEIWRYVLTSTASNSVDDRYSRHSHIRGWDQSRVASTRILIAGAGAIGNEVIKLLALIGVQRLTIVDFDVIETSNLTRSILFRDTDAGLSKAKVAAARAREINPDCRAVAIDGDLEFGVGLGVYRDQDIVIGCLDSINARLALNRCCLMTGVPWLNGGIEAEFGEVTLIASSGACFECSMTEQMWERRNLRYSCTGQLKDSSADAAQTVATIASVVAGILVNEALAQAAMEPGKPETSLKPGDKLFISIRPYHLHVASVDINPECTAHAICNDIELIEANVNEVTPADLIRMHGGTGASVELGFDLLVSMVCVNCGEAEEILVPVEKTHETLSLCTACSANTRRPETVAWIDESSELSSRTLSALGIPAAHILAVVHDGSRRWYQIGTNMVSNNW